MEAQCSAREEERIKCLPGPTVLSNVFPKTNRKRSCCRPSCQAFPWTNRAATRRQRSLFPSPRLTKADHRLCSANTRAVATPRTLAPGASGYE